MEHISPLSILPFSLLVFVPCHFSSFTRNFHASHLKFIINRCLYPYVSSFFIQYNSLTYKHSWFGHNAFINHPSYWACRRYLLTFTVDIKCIYYTVILQKSLENYSWTKHRNEEDELVCTVWLLLWPWMKKQRSTSRIVRNTM